MLRRYLNEFVGRENDLLRLARWFEGPSPIATIISPGGFGKSRLVHQFIVNLRAQECFVVCESEWTHRGILEVVRDGLGLDSGDSGQSAEIESTCRALEERDISLVVLDGVENQLAEVREFVQRALVHMPRTKFLVTSRLALDIEGEHWFELAPLESVSGAGMSPATRMLRARCEEYGVPFAEDDHDLVALSQRLEGIPLALEIAAARLRAVGPGEILDVLDDGFASLGAAPQSMGPRHRRLDYVISWSLDRLDDERVRALGTLSLLLPGFTVDSAAHVLNNTGGATVGLLEFLIGHGLLQRSDTDGEASRYVIYTVVREMALARLPLGERRAGLSRLVTGLLQKVGAGDPSALDCALHWRHRAELTRIADDSMPALAISFEDRLKATLALAEASARTGTRVWATSRLDVMTNHSGFVHCAAHLQAYVRLIRARFAAAVRDKEECRKQLEVVKDMRLSEPLELEASAIQLFCRIDHQAVTSASQLRELIGACGDRARVRLSASRYLVEAEIAAGNNENALAVCIDAVAQASLIEDWSTAVWVLLQKADVLRDLALDVEAAAAVVRARTLIDEKRLGHRFRAYAAYSAARIAVNQGEYGLALQESETSRRAFASNDETYGLVFAGLAEATARALCGEWERGERTARVALASHAAGPDAQSAEFGYGLLAATYAARGQMERFENCLVRAETLKPATNHIRCSPVFRLLAMGGNAVQAVRAGLAEIRVPLAQPATTAKFVVERVLRSWCHWPGEMRLLESTREVEPPAGPPVSLANSAKMWEALERLAHHRVLWPGQSVHGEAFMVAMWPEAGDPVSKKNRLRVVLAKLRKTLPNVPIQHVDGGYRIDPSVNVSIEKQ